jgi:hypothetical protein
MKTTIKISDDFTVEDIRRLRDDYAARYTDENGRFDWDGASAETKDGTARVLAEIARIRAERHERGHIQ